MKTRKNKELQFTHAIVLLTQGTDKVFLKTNFPSTFPSHVSTEPLTMQFTVAYRDGVAYVKKYFPDVEVEVRECQTMC